MSTIVRSTTSSDGTSGLGLLLRAAVETEDVKVENRSKMPWTLREHLALIEGRVNNLSHLEIGKLCGNRSAQACRLQLHHIRAGHDGFPLLGHLLAEVGRKLGREVSLDTPRRAARVRRNRRSRSRTDSVVRAVRRVRISPDIAARPHATRAVTRARATAAAAAAAGTSPEPVRRLMVTLRIASPPRDNTAVNDPPNWRPMATFVQQQLSGGSDNLLSHFHSTDRIKISNLID